MPADPWWPFTQNQSTAFRLRMKFCPRTQNYVTLLHRSKCTKTSYPEFCFPIPVITVYPPILGFMQSLPADFCHHPEDCLCYHHTSQGFYYCHHYYPSQLGINLIRSAWDCLPLIFARQLKIKGEKSSCLHCNLVKPYRIPSKGHRSCNINSSIPRDHIVPA